MVAMHMVATAHAYYNMQYGRIQTLFCVLKTVLYIWIFGLSAAINFAMT